MVPVVCCSWDWPCKVPGTCGSAAMVTQPQPIRRKTCGTRMVGKVEMAVWSCCPWRPVRCTWPPRRCWNTAWHTNPTAPRWRWCFAWHCLTQLLLRRWTGANARPSICWPGRWPGNCSMPWMSKGSTCPPWQMWSKLSWRWKKSQDPPRPQESGIGMYDVCMDMYGISTFSPFRCKGVGWEHVRWWRLCVWQCLDHSISTRKRGNCNGSIWLFVVPFLPRLSGSGCSRMFKAILKGKPQCWLRGNPKVEYCFMGFVF